MAIRLERKPDTSAGFVRVSTNPTRVRSLIKEYRKAGFKVKNVDKASIYVMGRGDLISFTVIPPVKQDNVG